MAGGDTPGVPLVAPDPLLRRARADLVASRENLEFLRKYLAARHAGLPAADAEDIIDTVMARLIDRITSGRWVPDPHPPMLRSYLRTAVDWAVVDFYRSGRREAPVAPDTLHELVLSDDQAAAALTETATVAGVHDALGHIQRARDATLFKVVTYMLDHIQRTGEQPSNRQTATACGISHTAVAKALVRMRPYFAQARQTARDP
jgi:DNA-directed RNA polymerase specialized sigma24 family protein